MSTQSIPLDRIVMGNQHHEHLCDLDAIADSIDRYGLLHPIGVTPQSDGTYELIFGRRRLEACRKLGHSTIEAKLVYLPATVTGEHDKIVPPKGLAASKEAGSVKVVEKTLGNPLKQRTDTQLLDRSPEVVGCPNAPQTQV